MNNNFLTTKINLQELSHALLFRCDKSQETQKKVNDFIKKVLCISKKDDLKITNLIITILCIFKI